MPAWQFQTHLNANQAVTIPPEIVAQLRPDETVQVVLKTAKGDDEDEDWQRFAAGQFLKGYAPGDDIYDQFPAG
jgi:hypothetical protein